MSALWLLGKSCRDQGKFEDAVEHLQAAVDKFGEN